MHRDMLLHSFSMLVGMLAVVTFGCCAAEDRARTAGSAIHVDTVPYKADPSWQPSVPLPLEIGAMSSCAVGSNGDTFVGTRVKAAADVRRATFVYDAGLSQHGWVWQSAGFFSVNALL